MLELCQDLRIGMYTLNRPRTAVSNVHGGGFVPDRLTGRCEPAEKLWRWLFESEFASMKTVIDQSGTLKGMMADLQYNPADMADALRYRHNALLRAWLKRRVAAEVEGGKDAAEEDRSEAETESENENDD